MAKSIDEEIKGIKQGWYVKVLHCKAENKGNVVATYGYFTSKEAAKNKGNAIELQNIPFTAVPDKDIFAQAYAAISKLEEFKNAVDC